MTTTQRNAPPTTAPPALPAAMETSHSSESWKSRTPEVVVRPSRPRHRWWLWLIVLIALVVGGYFAYRHFGPGSEATAPTTAAAASQPRRPATPVVAQRAVRGDLPIYLDGVGTAQALNSVTIHSRVDGELVKVLFEEGQFVQQNTLIAQIDPRAYDVQRSQAVAQMGKDQAALDNSKRDLTRYETAREAVPQQQLDTAASQVAQYEAAIKIDQSAIDAADLMLSYTQIRAPISGRMGLRNIDVGNIVHASDPNGLAVIAQVQPISVVFTLAQNALPQVQKAMKDQKEVKTLAYDTTLTKLMATGKVAALDNQIDLTSGTFRIKAIFDNQDNALFPNQFVNVRLLADTLKGVVLAPAQAIQRSPQSTFVDVITDDDTTDQRDVKVGPSEGDQTVIEEGVDEGEMLATAGLDRLEPGAKVIIQGAQTRGGRGSASQAGSQPTSQATPGGRGRRGGRGSTTSPGGAEIGAGVVGRAGTGGGGGSNP